MHTSSRGFGSSFSTVDEQVLLARQQVLQEAQAYYEQSKLQSTPAMPRLIDLLPLKKTFNDLVFRNAQKAETLRQLKAQVTLASTSQKLKKKALQHRTSDEYILHLVDTIQHYEHQAALQQAEQTQLRRMLSNQRDRKLLAKRSLEDSRRRHSKFVSINQSTEGVKTLAFSNLIKCKNYAFFANRSYTANKANRSTSLSNLRLQQNQLQQAVSTLSFRVAKRMVAQTEASAEFKRTHEDLVQALDSTLDCTKTSKQYALQVDWLQQQWSHFIASTHRYLDTDVGSTAESVVAAWKEVSTSQTSLQTQFYELSMTHQRLELELKRLRTELAQSQALNEISQVRLNVKQRMQSIPDRLHHDKLANSNENHIVEYSLRLQLLQEKALQALQLIKEHSGEHSEAVKLTISRVTNKSSLNVLDFKKLQTVRATISPRETSFQTRTPLPKQSVGALPFKQAKQNPRLTRVVQSLTIVQRFLSPKRIARELFEVNCFGKETQVSQLIENAHKQCLANISQHVVAIKALLRTVDQKAVEVIQRVTQEEPQSSFLTGKPLNPTQVTDLLRLIFHTKFQSLIKKKQVTAKNSSRFSLAGCNSNRKSTTRPLKKPSPAPRTNLSSDYRVLRQQLKDLFKTNSKMKPVASLDTFRVLIHK